MAKVTKVCRELVLVLRSIYFSGIALRCRCTPTLLDFSIWIATTRDVRDSFLRDDISSRLRCYGITQAYVWICMRVFVQRWWDQIKASSVKKDRVCMLNICVTPNSTQNHSIGNMTT